MEFFDQIMPLNVSGTEYAGYLTAMNEEFYIHLTVHDSKFENKVQLRGCKKLEESLKPEFEVLEQHLNHCSSISNMLKEIQNLLEQSICTKTRLHSDMCTDYTILFEQLQICGWEKVKYISPDFEVLHLKSTDSCNREHILKVWIPEKFPNEAPKLEYDLPQDFSYKWLPGDTLLNLYTAFEEKLNAFVEFWNNMDEIDCKTWVIEPEKPSRKDCKRRIALASGVSLLLVVNPLMPTTIPMCNYLGPERIIEPVREKFNTNIHLWSEFESLLHNLQNILDLEFPSPTTTTKEEFCLECGICYSHFLGDAIPEMTCDNSNCNQAFHHECLYEYIRMLPDVRSSFNKLFGQCPYCSQPLWCAIP